MRTLGRDSRNGKGLQYTMLRPERPFPSDLEVDVVGVAIRPVIMIFWRRDQGKPHPGLLFDRGAVTVTVAITSPAFEW
jgi:hypothetical protein